MLTFLHHFNQYALFVLQVQSKEEVEQMTKRQSENMVYDGLLGPMLNRVLMFCEIVQAILRDSLSHLSFAFSLFRLEKS